VRAAASLVLAAAAILLCAAKAPEQSTIRYKLTPGMWVDNLPAVEVDMRFRGDADGETVLALPSEWAGSTRLWEHVKLLEIHGATRLSGTYDRTIIHHDPGARIRISYLVVSAYEEDPGFGYEKARLVARPNHFFFHGESVFAAPEGRQAANARFRWGKPPEGWRVASDLDHLRGKRTTVANLIDSVAIGGRDLKVETRQIGRAPLRVAVLGRWPFEPAALADAVAPIVAAADALWEEESSPFLVAMAPLGDVPSGLSYTGTGRTDAFSIASTSAFSLKDAKRFLAHEYLHSWLPIMLGRMPVEEARDNWFSEGFTDYLAAKLLVRAGLWTPEEYAADKNETLLRYGTSPAQTVSDSEIAQRFWTDPFVQQVGYDRGHLLAARLDAEIAARTEGKESLESVLRAQRRMADGSAELATNLFRRTVLEKTGIDIEGEVEAYARRGEPLTLPADLFGECARIVKERRKAFDRGFDADSTRRAGGVIAGVDRDGPAYAAGMREGMRLVRREAGKIGDASVEIAYRVADEAGGERVIRYLPESRNEFQVQRIELAASGAQAEAACRARFGGESRIRAGG
jgi:predicted metalloprotease with PDZ domain